ncbi:MAG: hypothetical protein HC811_13475 [Flammeovirgaceae bacterium]|nr:hypothetical protein [Flammeovirgaceae bacterium]
MIFDPTVVNSKIIELNKERINTEHSLELVNSVHVIEGFTKFNKPVFPKKSISMVTGATLGLFFIGFYIAFKSVRKLVRVAEEYKPKEIA